MKKFVVAWLAILTLVSCAQMERRKADEEIGKISTACFRGFNNEPAMSALRGKIVLKENGNPTIEMLNDQRRVAQEEKEAVAIFDKMAVSCVNLIIQVATPHYPQDALAVMHEGAVAGQQARLWLYSGKMTFGEFNSVIQQNSVTLKKKMAEVDRTMHRRRLEQSQQIANTMGTFYMLNQMTQPQHVQPVNTTCMRNGTTVNCTSY